MITCGRVKGELHARQTGSCLRSSNSSPPQVLVEEAAAVLEILVVAGWQFGPLVLGEALGERDHFAGRRRCSRCCRPNRLGAVAAFALNDLVCWPFGSAWAADNGADAVGGNFGARSAVPLEWPTPGTGRGRLTEVDGAAGYAAEAKSLAFSASRRRLKCLSE